MSSAVQDLLERKNNPEHRNWLAVGDALLILSDGIRKYAGTKLSDLHAVITLNVGAGVRCHCSYTLGKKPNPHGRTTICKWAEELKKFHKFSRKEHIPWHQSDSSQWHDPVRGTWEIAKLFMSELGENTATTKDPNTTDCASLLNLLINCSHFKIPSAVLKAVKNWRNTWAHAPNQKLSDSGKQDAFNAISVLLNDPEFTGNKDVQTCLSLIRDTEKADFAGLQNQVTIIQKYAQEIKDTLDEIKREIRPPRKDDIFSNFIIAISSIILAALLSTASTVQRKLSGVLWSLMAFFMLSQVGDKSLISDYGCPSAVIKSPISHFDFQEFDFSAYLAYKREGFVGRKWFFFEIETIFEESLRITGVLITGEPGSGKSALMSQLICSPYSSLLIHENIIGYHLCEYSEKGKRSGARFVRNLVDQIAARLPEYAKYVANNERVRAELDARCHKDPTECFFSTIVGPLRNLKPPDNPKFIVIDALDECLESDVQTSEIIDILKNKILHFPKWLKVILTSRNLTAVTSRLPLMQINRTSLFATDERNINDIKYYVSRFVSQNSQFSDRLLTALKIHSGTEDMKIFLDEVITRSEGNFLFVKTTLQYINDAGGKINLKSLPTSLFDLYTIFFERQFGVGGFGPFRYFFEVLLAVYSPLHLQEVEDILRSEYEAVGFKKRIGHVSCFLRFGRDGTVRIYHQSFSEWLKGQATVFSINQTRGHQSIARFSLRRMRNRKEDITFGELTELFMHILSGRSLEVQETALNLFNVTQIREHWTNQSILHYLVRRPIIYQPVLDFFLRKFQTVDVLDFRNKTPAFYAASEGLVRSLQSCIENGADINAFLEGYKKLDPVTAVVRNTGIEEFSLLHVAVAKGYTNVVELLLKSNITSPVSAKHYPTPLHLAAANGDLEMVKTLYEHRENFDQVALHHAAARNHSAIVRFILSTVGLRDACLECQHEYFWQLSKKTIHEIHAFFCETALHAAVSRGLVDMVQLLLDFGKEALECKHHSGKTVLMDAVERNDTEMVELLLKHGANATAVCGQKITRDISTKLCSIFHKHMHEFMYKVYCANEICNCGYSAIHISAKYGLWKVAEILFNHERIEDLLDCAGDSAAHVAAVYDHQDFLQNYNISLEKIGQHLVRSSTISLAVQYCSAQVTKLLLNYPSDEDENMWELLLRSVRWFSLSEKIYSSYCLKAFAANSLSEAEEMQKESERRLNMLKLLIDAHHDKLLVLYKEENEMTLLHYAASFGFTDAVKYLVELGANTLLTDKNGNTPLMNALKNSPVNSPTVSYRCYTTNDGFFTSCTTNSYDESVSYLIKSQRASISKCDHKTAFMLKNVILKRMPLSLYALLDIGVDWNCRLHDDFSPMLFHLFTGGWEMTELLKMFEVDGSLKCGVSFYESELHQMAYFVKPGEFGNFFKARNQKRLPLQKFIDRHPRGVRIVDECYDDKGFLPLHHAIQGGNLYAIKWLKNIGANLLLETRNGLTTIESSIHCLGDGNCRSAYTDSLNDLANFRIECFEEILRTFFEYSRKNYSTSFSSVLFDNSRNPEPPILSLASEVGVNVVKIVYEKALAIIPSLKRNKYMILNEQDADGNTPLHHAASHGFENVVKYLVEVGCDINIRNRFNKTPLLTALLGAPPNFIKSEMKHHCYTTSDGVFTSCETTPYDFIVGYLISSQKSRISRCHDENAFILDVLIRKRMPLGLYALLKNGVDINCQTNNESFSNFLKHIIKGGQQVSEVLKMFGVNVLVQCGKPFLLSELHLIAYLPVSDNFGNFFKPSQNGKRSPLQRLIYRYRKGVRILSDCYDASGYLPIHYAIMGGNLDALKWFKEIGANAYLKERDSVNALRLSILCLGDNNCSEVESDLLNKFSSTNFVKSHLDHRCYTTNDGVFTSCETTPYDEIVRYLISSRKSKIFRCDNETSYILHLLITKRMPLSLYALLNSGVDINCRMENESNSNFLKHMKNGGQQVSEVLKMFEVNVSVQCDIPSSLSELHYISYVPESGNFGNFFKPSQNGKQSPLKRLLDHHPRGARILNECYDDEGYLPIHMAAKGGNFEALKWFQRKGANMHLKARNGLTALYISILNLGKANYEVISRKPKYRRRIFKLLLRTFFGANPESKLLCGSSLDGLSLLHIAAVKGMSVLKYVHKEASKFLPNLPINCINKHGIDPIFLARFYESVLNEGIVEESWFGETYDIYINDIMTFLKSGNQWDKSADEIWKEAKPHEVKRRGNYMKLDFGDDNVPPAQYPDREIMNIIVFNYLYRPMDTEINSHFESENNLLTGCPGYYNTLPEHRDEEFKLDIPDLSKCSEIRDDFHKLLCTLEVKSKLVRKICYQGRKILELLLIPRRRRGRQLSSFILKVLGWTDSYREDNVAHQWPFYFLHKMFQKKYEAYRYITVLNEALEFTSIRFAMLK
ncbi:uncharacterized protein LOC114517613 [Dendronephthya gigantea]|uniref:uncharacterized protein LOC114517613 n=1 Tax=Dendronephthya gigantea TaxID=151771 RepID=UPI00106C4AEB|nr:uncharacterized protein LOC114517613 [Dendronephthya gigantea]